MSAPCEDTEEMGQARSGYGADIDGLEGDLGQTLSCLSVGLM
jgi:hypothetical protein